VPKREKVTGNQRKLCNEKLHDLYFFPHYLGDQIKEDEVERVCDVWDRWEIDRNF
jgi:hypothetical protein